jgi:predicted DNA-binding transcriptional regulator AlpA
MKPRDHPIVSDIGSLLEVHAMTRTPGRLLKPAEVADLLGTTTGTLAMQRYKGTGPKFVKINGSRVMYKPEDIEAFISQNTFTQTGGAA